MHSRAQPMAPLPRSSLVSDGAGNLYGTTESGGSDNYGTVFEVTRNGSEAILHSFRSGTDGDAPLAGLVRDKSGNLYGTTLFGGETVCERGSGCGVIFEVTAKGHEKVLHVFGDIHSGRNPAAALLLGKHDRVIYGTTSAGGRRNNGVVFELKE